jgi:hypothetical protein
VWRLRKARRRTAASVDRIVVGGVAVDAATDRVAAVLAMVRRIPRHQPKESHRWPAANSI